MSDYFLSGPDLVKAFEPYLSINTLNKWVAGGNVKTKEGLRSLLDTAIALCGKLHRENERLKSEAAPSDELREEIDRARLRKLLLEGDIIEIDRDEKQGKLIAVEEAIAEIEDGFTRVKTKLMALPDRLALEISGLSDPTEIRGILADTVREALQELHFDITGDDGQVTHSD